MNFQVGSDGNLYTDSTENPQFSTQLSNSDNISIFTDTEESHLSTPVESNSKRSRGGNFTAEENLLIVSAWLNTSLDVVQGNEQKHKTYWARLWEYFHKYKNFESERTQVSLMNRWSTIQLATNKFCGCYAQIESRNQSGINEQDKIANAKFLYQELNKCKFQFEHCWNVLRLQPKWKEDCQKKKPIKKKDKSPTPTSETQVNFRDDNITIVAITKDMENDPTGSYVNLLQEMRDEKRQFNEKKLELFEKAYIQGQERLAYEQEKLQLEQMKEDERIMAIDPAGMPQMLANFYIQRQKEISERRSKN
ncbi:glutathione S-transferase T2-like [Pistacia vera]|uniref:glutathione S-transferase T2-like n=1 Tax=Pistacia vera TaxID=55513 RepID=UPI0012637CA1|nr:glutathione S-transferase T2-like [Pistacia vera]